MTAVQLLDELIHAEQHVGGKRGLRPSLIQTGGQEGRGGWSGPPSRRFWCGRCCSLTSARKLGFHSVGGKKGSNFHGFVGNYDVLRCNICGSVAPGESGMCEFPVIRRWSRSSMSLILNSSCLRVEGPLMVGSVDD